LRHRDRAG